METLAPPVAYEKIRGVTLGDVNMDLPLFTYPRNPTNKGAPVPSAHNAGAPSHETPGYIPPNRSFAFDGFSRDGTPYTFAPDSILRLKPVIDVTGLSRSSIYSYIKKGAFPQARKLGLRAVGWHASEVFEWVATRGHNT